jgi:zinc finger protein
MAALPQGDDWRKGDEEDISEIHDCFCVNCKTSQGRTVMLPTKVPFFREIVIMSFLCDNCNFKNSEINFGGELQEKGERITLHVTNTDDLNRQIIKSDSCSMLIPQLELEIPPLTQRGTMSTIEGMLKRAAENLEALQPERLRLGDIDNFHRCKKVIDTLLIYSGDKQDEDEEPIEPFPFDIILDDPAGNSFIENPLAPSNDPQLKASKYIRTANQDMSLGLQPSEQARESGNIDDSNPTHKNIANSRQGHRVEIHRAAEDPESVKQEVMKFMTPCPHCFKPAETDMCLTDIPHFKEVIIMSLVCEHCGYRSNEIKGGGAIPKYGTKIILTVTSEDDLAREVLKSDTAGLIIPEVDMELDEGGLDGLYTTVEGLLNKVHDRLKEANPFGSGDSAKKQHLDNDGGDFSKPSPNYVRYMEFLGKLKKMANSEMFPFSIVISDPLSNSFVGPIPKDAIALSLKAEKDGNNSCYEGYVDTGMQVDEYERTHDQNEILGLNDMRTENYQQDLVDRIQYGTDMQDDLPDRIRRLDVRGPDHPHQVGKAPVEGDNTIMGAGSDNFAVPAMGQRGKASAVLPTIQQEASGMSIAQLYHKYEHDDDEFQMADDYNGKIEGMVFKTGAQGLGYYTDIAIKQLVAKYQ